jgi:hypothetical protein
MIRLPGTGTLSDRDRRGLTLLTDLARLIPVTDDRADIVAIDLTERPLRFDSLKAWQAAQWGIAAGDGVVRVSRAALEQVADVTSATRERTTTHRDRLGRVPSDRNALVAEGLERTPIVSEAARAFRTAAHDAAGRRLMRLTIPWPDGRRWAVALTHDVDIIAWWPLFTALRLAELVRKGEARRAGRAVLAALGAIGKKNPAQVGIAELLRVEREHSVHSTWFFLCGTPGLRTFLAGDLTYLPESEDARLALAAVGGDGHAVGLHGSHATLTAPDVFAEQRSRLTHLAQRTIAGVRQHFLRFDPHHTPQAMRQAEFAYDSTAGFPDRNGFRLGVCDVLPEWSTGGGAEGEGKGRPLAEVPFAWMDRALSKYRGIEDPDAWITDALELAGVCRNLEGLWVGVWHPNLIPALGYPGAPPAYDQLLQRLLTDRPFVGTLDELVAWRQARARLTIGRVAPDGRLELKGTNEVSVEEPRP